MKSSRTWVYELTHLEALFDADPSLVTPSLGLLPLSQTSYLCPLLVPLSQLLCRLIIPCFTSAVSVSDASSSILQFLAHFRMNDFVKHDPIL